MPSKSKPMVEVMVGYSEAGAMVEVTARLVPGSVVMVKDGENSGTHALFRNQCLAARRGSLSPAMATLVQNLSPATLATTPMKTVESVVNVGVSGRR